jgi:hypothetical protein
VRSEAVDPSKAARNKPSFYGEVALEQTNHIRSSVNGCSCKATHTHKLTKYLHQPSETHQTQKGAIGGGSLDLTIIGREVTRCVLHPTTRIDGGLASCRLRTGSACGTREPRTPTIVPCATGGLAFKSSRANQSNQALPSLDQSAEMALRTAYACMPPPATPCPRGATFYCFT